MVTGEAKHAVKNFKNLSAFLRGEGIGVLNRVELFSRFSEISAEELLGGGDIEYLLLHFSKLQICLLAIGETDEIQIAPTPHWNVKGMRDLSTVSPWNKVIGKELFAAWHLVNDGGYDDGFQFSFGQEAIRLQIETVASHISFNMLTPVL